MNVQTNARFKWKHDPNKFKNTPGIEPKEAHKTVLPCLTYMCLRKNRTAAWTGQNTKTRLDASSTAQTLQQPCNKYGPDTSGRSKPNLIIAHTSPLLKSLTSHDFRKKIQWYFPFIKLRQHYLGIECVCLVSMTYELVDKNLQKNWV